MKKITIVLITLFMSVISFAQVKSQSNWQQQVSYQIDVRLADTTHLLYGFLSVDYLNNSPDELSEIYFHLWPNAYKNNQTALAKQLVENGKTEFYHRKEDESGAIIDLKFKVDGEEVKWALTEDNIDVAKLSLNSALKSGESIRITTPFVVEIPKVFSRLGHEEQDYYITQWYPKPAVYDVNGWNAMPYLDQGEFYSEFGDFTVNITLPNNYVIAATGELQNESEKQFLSNRIDHPISLPKDSVPNSDKEYKTVTFTANNVHDFAWFASKSFNVVRAPVKINDKTIETYVYSKKVRESWLGYVKTALVYYSENVGPYPYPHASVVHGELDAGGGMEYPMITICDIMAEDVVVHEVGHNWFYGILGTNERRYPWMDESINSYCDGEATRIDGSVSFGDVFQDKVMRYFANDKSFTNDAQPVTGTSEDFSFENYGIYVYGIGAQNFEYLRQYLGPDIYKKAMQEYYLKWKFKHPLPQDMKAVFEAVSGKELDWFFNDIQGSTKSFTYKLDKKGDELFLKNTGEIVAPVPVNYSVNGQSKVIWMSCAIDSSVKVELPVGLESAVIDSKEITPMWNYNDHAARNVIKPRLLFGQDRKQERELFLFPAIGYNVFDQTMYGLGFHNYSFANKPFQYHLIPMFAPETEQIVGVASMEYIHKAKGIGSYFTLGLDAQRFSWTQNNFRNFLYTKIQPSLTYFLPKKNHRSVKERSINIKYNNISFDPEFDLNADRLASQNPGYTTMMPWNFIVAEYRVNNKSKINGFDFRLEIEQAFTATKSIISKWDTTFVNNGSEVDTIRNFNRVGETINKSNHTKISAILEYKLDIGLDKKPLILRSYISMFLNSPEDGYFSHYVSSAGNVRDYRFDRLVMHRNANYGMFRNQITDHKSYSRFVGILGQSQNMIANLLISAPIPGKIPIRPYLELLTYTDIDKSSFNKSGSSLIYNFGLEITVIPNRFHVFLNLGQSEDVSAYQDITNANDDSFLDRITFTLDLNGLKPPALKRNINIFN